jgi:CubicO group peptidase (beta-lactamase class C family)
MKFITLALLFNLVFAPLAPAPPAPPQNDPASRIRRVERGLTPPVPVRGEAGWTIEERMRHYKVPGLSVAVINNFKVEWARAYGVKDSETLEAADVRTLFQAASISKPVTAAAALNRVERGRLSLDENINDRLASWKLPENDFTAKKKVTLGNLLSHTAGLTVHGFPGYAVGEKLPTVPQILDGAAPANTAAVRVNMEPGTRFRYSGGGTTVVQLALTDIERKPFPEIVREAVFKPVGMEDSTYEQPLAPGWRKRAASGHRQGGKPVEGKIHVYPEMAPAGLWTTPTDLAKFAVEVQLSLLGKSNRVLSKAMTERMLTPFPSASTGPDSSVGLGFFLDKKGRGVYFGHGGANEGFRCVLTAHKEKGYGAVVMVNSDDGRIMDEVLGAIAREYGWEEFAPQPAEVVRVAAEKLDAYVGRYRVNPDRVVTVTREGARLFAEPTGSSKMELLPVSETRFIRRDAPVQYSFVTDAEGKVARMAVHEGAAVAPSGEAPRLAPGDFVPAELLLAGKTAEASDAYRKIKKEQPDNAAVAENRLNDFGYQLLRLGRRAEAIVVFALNVEFYPASSNTYDSLGEAYMENGDTELAIKNYRRSLELDPGNGNAVQMLKKLEQKK